jgi:maleate isomerase
MTGVEPMDKLQWKAKIGLIVVSSSTVAETRYPRVAPPDVGFFTSRMMLRPGGDIEALVEMEAGAGRAVEELASAHVDSIAYCCTVSGALRGPEKDAEFCREMEEQCGVSTTSTMLACTEALKHMGMKKVVVTSPYPDSHHVAEEAYLEASGIHPLVMKGMGLQGGQSYGAVTPEEVYDFSLEAWQPYSDEADGLFVSCMNLDAMPAIEALEEAIGKPVVTSHSATLWRAMSLAGYEEPVTGYGRLLAQPREVGARLGS